MNTVTHSAIIMRIVVKIFLLAGLVACGQSNDNAESIPHTQNKEVVSASETVNPPNVIIILADDIGVETVGAYGSEYLTPRIDSIAANGMRFDSAHATPICTPSRVRLLTGRYNYKNYVDFAVLDAGENTIAHQMQQAGFRTLVAGKWQLSGTGDEDDPDGVQPQDAGFDEQLVWYLARSGKGSRYWAPRLIENGTQQQYEETEFGPTIVNQRVVDFISDDDSKPFFIYYSMMLAHKAWVTTPVSLEATSDKDRFRGMMSYMDEMVGNVLDALEVSGKTDNTLVFFIGDNGTHPDITSLRHGVPVQGGKWNTNYRGTLVPFEVQWPAEIPAGTVSSQIVDLMDVMPTVLSATGGHISEILDGYNLVPELISAEGSGRDWVFMHFDPHQDQDESLTSPSRFVFNNHWKYYSDGRMYNLQSDAEELNPLDINALESDAINDYQTLSVVMKEHGQRPFFHEQDNHSEGQ